MKIFITGGNGYVGRELTRLLCDEHDVCVADCVRYGQIRFADRELSKFRFERVDIGDSKIITRLVEDFHPDTIIHLAAIHFIPECEKNPQLTLQTNVLGTVNLLLAAPRNSRFVYASSGAVYKPDDRPHCEVSSEIEPRDMYGLSKLHGEHYVRYIAEHRGLAAVTVRLFNVIGPGETNPHLLPEIIAQLMAGRITVRLGNLTPKRDYIHVFDAAQGFKAAALNHSVAPGRTVTVNLGTSHQYSVGEIIEKLRSITNIDFLPEHDPARVRPVDRPFLAADNTQMQRLFGWAPTFTIDEALADIWRRPDLAEALVAKYQ